MPNETDNTNNKLPHIVIIGAGFGGLAIAKALRKQRVEVTLIDKRNYHLFQPLLYQVATADLSPADIAWPIRSIFRGQKNISVMLSKVLDVDVENKKVVTEVNEVSYDHLIVANGSTHSYFGKDEWADHAPGLKRIVDATQVRRQVLMAFERAELEPDPIARERELTFVIVGAGPTGVELAGAIAELANVTMCKDFRQISSNQARIILIEAGPRILSAFPQKLSAKAQTALEKLGVEVRTNTLVEDVDDNQVVANKEIIPTETTIWAAGVRVEGVSDWLGAEADRAGRILVEPDLTVPGHPEISVIGDAASVAWKDGKTVPGIAPAAKQEGTYVARRLTRLIQGKPKPEAFKYKHLGNLATIGRNYAIADFGPRFRLSGRIAWWLWGFVHIYFIIGVKRPLVVALSWFSNYIFHSKGARLITGIKELRLQKPANKRIEK